MHLGSMSISRILSPFLNFGRLECVDPYKLCYHKKLLPLMSSKNLQLYQKETPLQTSKIRSKLTTKTSK